jgi:tetratricopeptide (TPR) repeat protein
MVLAGLTGASRELAAQSRGYETRTSLGQRMVRSELAAVLLQSGRFEEAAREYRLLVAGDPRNRAYRLNLARALAWGEHPREAETVLAPILREHPGDDEVVKLLRTVRADLEPRSSEAVVWVGEDPVWLPYRLALARALVRDGHPRLAIEQYQRLLAGGPDLPPGPVLRAELAAVLATVGRQAEALAYYDTLLATAPTATLFTERAALRLERGDTVSARRDLASALAIAPNVEAYLMIGNLYRERGDNAAAAAAFRAARALGPDGARRAAQRLAQLARELRPAVALVPAVGEDPGWLATFQSAQDNLGVQFTSAGVTRAVDVGEAVVSAGVEYRLLRDDSAGEDATLNGAAARLGASRAFARGPYLVRFALTGGAVRHEHVPAIAEGRAQAALWRGAWQLALDAAHEAAYVSLLTLASLRAGDATGAPLTDDRLTAAIAGPIGAADIALSVGRSHLSDGNRLTTVQAYARYALAPNVYGVYAVTSQGFAERSARYWDPMRYVAHEAGVEFAADRRRGLSWSLRALPGIAASHELATTRVVRGRFDEDTVLTRAPVHLDAVQLELSGDLAWRFAGWEVAAGVGYGRGRAGDYQRLGAILAVRRNR